MAPDARVILFTAVAALIAAMLFGMAPAAAARAATPAVWLRIAQWAGPSLAGYSATRWWSRRSAYRWRC